VNRDAVGLWHYGNKLLLCVCVFYFSRDESWQTIERGEVSSAATLLTWDVPYLQILSVLSTPFFFCQ
jgi:hypothetical protein